MLCDAEGFENRDSPPCQHVKGAVFVSDLERNDVVLNKKVKPLLECKAACAALEGYFFDRKRCLGYCTNDIDIEFKSRPSHGTHVPSWVSGLLIKHLRIQNPQNP